MLGRRKLLFGLAAAATLTGVGGLYFVARRRPVQPDSAALLGLVLPDLAGQPVAVEQWRGKVLAINFWATWCPPCRAEIPDFIRAQGDYGSKGLQVVGIAIDDPAKVRRFVADLGINYPQLLADDAIMDLSRSLGNVSMGLPFTVIVDRRGAIAYTRVGMVSAKQLNGSINQLL